MITFNPAFELIEMLHCSYAANWLEMHFRFRSFCWMQFDTRGLGTEVSGECEAEFPA